jgi:hypothetical protein
VRTLNTTLCKFTSKLEKINLIYTSDVKTYVLWLNKLTSLKLTDIYFMI